APVSLPAEDHPGVQGSVDGHLQMKSPKQPQLWSRTAMLKYLNKGIALGLLLLAGGAQAELSEDYKVILLTENFPPFNMAIDEKNFARDDNIDGISADLTREVFKRAGIGYSLSLRFPWDRIYR